MRRWFDKSIIPFLLIYSISRPVDVVRCLIHNQGLIGVNQIKYINHYNNLYSKEGEKTQSLTLYNDDDEKRYINLRNRLVSTA